MIDKMHFRGHVDEWCKKNCNPYLLKDLKDVRYCFENKSSLILLHCRTDIFMAFQIWQNDTIHEQVSLLVFLICTFVTCTIGESAQHCEINIYHYKLLSTINFV